MKNVVFGEIFYNIIYTYISSFTVYLHKKYQHTNSPHPVRATILDKYEFKIMFTETHIYNIKTNASPTICLKISGEERVFLSSYSIYTEDVDPNDQTVYHGDLLNKVKLGGFPKHELKLKVGVPVMCLLNINPNVGLCNGTRLIVTQMARYAIQAMIITGSKKKIGDIVLITRMFLSPGETKYPFRMRRRQFPLTLAFAMTINKIQGQSLKHVGLYLPRHVFSHGQLYVALLELNQKMWLEFLSQTKTKRLKQRRQMLYSKRYSIIYLRHSVKYFI